MTNAEKNKINSRLSKIINSDTRCIKLYFMQENNEYSEELYSREYRLWHALMRIQYEIRRHILRIAKCNNTSELTGEEIKNNEQLKEMLLIDEELLYDEAVKLLNDYDALYSQEAYEHTYYFLYGESIIDKLHRNYKEMKLDII